MTVLWCIYNTVVGGGNLRKEKKYIVDVKDIDDVILLSKKIGHIDKYSGKDSSYDVESFYRLIWETDTASGKIRLRKYSADGKVTCFLENKYKKNGNSFKKRSKIDTSVYSQLIKQNNINSTLRDIYKINSELLFFINEKNSQLKLEQIKLFYKRRAFLLEINGNEYRLTIDSDLSIDYNNSKIRIIPQQKCILEIKGKKLKPIQELYKLDRFANRCKISKYKRALYFINSKEVL